MEHDGLDAASRQFLGVYRISKAMLTRHRRQQQRLDPALATKVQSYAKKLICAAQGPGSHLKDMNTS
jgi:hypothetical protein